MALGAGLGGAAAGKRVRPLLCLLTAEALIGDSTPALPFAVAIELMHSFALVHDDIEDGDQWRRGMPAVWVRYGLPHGINIGDGLLTRAFGVLAESDFPPPVQVRLIRLLADTLSETIEGQALDINARSNPSTTVAEYMDLVTRKTGRYLAAPLVGGAIAVAADEDCISRLGALGPVLGPLFQILDDLIDLSDGKGREATGNGVREGKRSYLAVHTLAQGGAPARRLLDILDTPREDTTPAMVAEAAHIMSAAGAMDAARAETDRLRQQASILLDGIQPPALATALRTVVDHLAARRT
jgi:geranylgeranyl diphosphate synthase type I